MNISTSIDSTHLTYKRTTEVQPIGHTITVYRDDAAQLVGHLDAAEGMIFVARCDAGILVVGQTADIEPRILARSIQKHGALTQLALIRGIEDVDIRATLTRALHQHLVAARVTVAGTEPLGGGVTVLQYDTARALAASMLMQLNHAGLLPRGVCPANLLSGPEPAPAPQELYDAVDAATDGMLLNGWAVRAIQHGEQVILLPGSELWVSSMSAADPDRADVLMPLIHHGRVVQIGGWIYRLAQPVLFDTLDDAAHFALGSLAKGESWRPAPHYPSARMDAIRGRNRS